MITRTLEYLNDIEKTYSIKEEDKNLKFKKVLTIFI
jgi:hypothetical protein